MLIINRTTIDPYERALDNCKYYVKDLLDKVNKNKNGISQMSNTELLLDIYGKITDLKEERKRMSL